MILHLILHNISLISDPGTEQSVEHGDKLIQQLAQQDAMEQVYQSCQAHRRDY